MVNPVVHPRDSFQFMFYLKKKRQQVQVDFGPKLFESISTSPSLPEVPHNIGAANGHMSRLVCDHKFRGCLFSCPYTT